MFKLKNIVILFVVVLLIVSIGSQVKATNLTLDLTNLQTTNTVSDDDTNSTDDTNATTNETALNVATNEENSQVVQPTTNTNSSSSNDLPQTGVTEDITVMFFIIVCVISAIYAYKKIRDYKD